MYDYIIVGAGSAGCVLAKRLSEKPDCRVLLIEAGQSDWNPFIHMPAGVGELLKHNWTNWCFDTDREAELDNRCLYWPRGKVLGGSSAMNGMIYIRGHQHDYDNWAALPGCDGWNYDAVLPWFKKSENFVAGADEFHGTGGELGVSPPSVNLELNDTFRVAGEQAGFAVNPDFNGAVQEGVGPYHCTIRDGVRQSTSRTFLTPDVRKRSNLTILTRARVSRLLLEGEGDDKRVIGVELVRNGRYHQLRCNREVLLCAGAVQSPQVLLLSGIGPQAALAEHDIKPLHELPGVGENLQDHLDISVQYHATQPVSLYDQTKWYRAAVTLLQYLTTHKGLGTTNGIEAGAFLRTSHAGDEPDIQLHFIPVIMLDHMREPGPGHGFMVHACQLRPYSRGRIRLWSADPQAAPRIEANYLSDARDLPVMLEAIKICRQILTQPAFDAYRGDELMPGAKVQSDEELTAFVRRAAETIYHPVGTCRMGAQSDAMAVVDAQCRVHGIQGLRVIDASVMPNLIGGNTNAPVIMIAERMAADILNVEC